MKMEKLSKNNIKTISSQGNLENKLKILAIHGYRQNGEVFRQKTGSFRKIIQKWANLKYVTAPHKVVLVDNIDNLEIGQSSDEEQYGWFFNRDDKSYRGIRTGGPAIGFEESVKIIERICKIEGPFDGILGFSQGGCFVALICALQQKGFLNVKFSFAIMVSGFKSGCLPHLKYYNETISMPTLHVFGTNDQIIPTEMSETLSEAFEDPVIVRHSGGHYFPASSAQKNVYQEFLRLQAMNKNTTD